VSVVEFLIAMVTLVLLVAIAYLGLILLALGVSKLVKLWREERYRDGRYD
jgi:hypothetical protein